MTDIQQTALEKEAYLYAVSIGADKEIELITRAWEECVHYLTGLIHLDGGLQTKDDVVKKLFKMTGYR